MKYPKISLTMDKKQSRFFVMTLLVVVEGIVNGVLMPRLEGSEGVRVGQTM